MNILETQRLTLRQMEKKDIEDIYKKVFKNNEVVKYTFWSDFSSYNEVKDFINRSCNFDENLGLSILVENSSNNIIGLAGVLECNYLHVKDYEIGFILEEESWGKGYATEIGQAQIDFVRDKLKAKRVLAIAHPSNMGSIKCIE